MGDPREPGPAARIHAFADDALGTLDAVGMAGLLASGELRGEDLVGAALDRAEAVAGRLGAIAHPAQRPRRLPGPATLLAGVPTYVKDNLDVRGMPTGHGTSALVPPPAREDGAYVRQLLGTGLTVLGKSRMPEFGFNASTEFVDAPPARNPWNPGFSVGGSSGGAAALVAAGVVPLAHANDGGGSIRIPAAAAGLVGLKPSRGRHRDDAQARSLPINLISEGVLTRSVRDTAVFVRAMEAGWRNLALPPVGEVTGPSSRRLRIGLLDATVGPARLDATTRGALEATARLLESLGHRVEPVPRPVDEGFAEDFRRYWTLLSLMVSVGGKAVLHRSFDPGRVDPLTRGLRQEAARQLPRMPGALRRLEHGGRRALRMFGDHEVVLSPVTTQRTPVLGHLSPEVGYETLMERLRGHVGFPPLANIAGIPSISLPGDLDADGLPTSTMLSAARGDERTLLELAFELEQARPFPRITDPGRLGGPGVRIRETRDRGAGVVRRPT